MTDIIIYSKEHCPYCIRAKALLRQKGQAFTELRIDEHPDLRDDMISQSGGRATVPQIFINCHHIGGCDDLYELERLGQLNALLN